MLKIFQEDAVLIKAGECDRFQFKTSRFDFGGDFAKETQ